MNRGLLTYTEQNPNETHCSCNRNRPNCRSTCQHNRHNCRSTCQQNRHNCRSTCQQNRPNCRSTCQQNRPNCRSTCQQKRHNCRSTCQRNQLYDNNTQVELARIWLHWITECISPCTNTYNYCQIRNSHNVPLGCYSASTGKSSPTFRIIVAPSSSGSSSPVLYLTHSSHNLCFPPRAQRSAESCYDI